MTISEQRDPAIWTGEIQRRMADLFSMGVSGERLFEDLRIRTLWAQVLRFETEALGYRTTDLSASHRQRTPGMGPGFAVFCRDDFVAAISVEGLAPNLHFDVTLTEQRRADLDLALHRGYDRMQGRVHRPAPAAPPHRA